jgi:hypothetical protein
MDLIAVKRRFLPDDAFFDDGEDEGGGAGSGAVAAGALNCGAQPGCSSPLAAAPGTPGGGRGGGGSGAGGAGCEDSPSGRAPPPSTAPSKRLDGELSDSEGEIVEKRYVCGVDGCRAAFTSAFKFEAHYARSEPRSPPHPPLGCAAPEQAYRRLLPPLTTPAFAAQFAQAPLLKVFSCASHESPAGPAHHRVPRQLFCRVGEAQAHGVFLPGVAVSLSPYDTLHTVYTPTARTRHGHRHCRSLSYLSCPAVSMPGSCL